MRENDKVVFIEATEDWTITRMQTKPEFVEIYDVWVEDPPFSDVQSRLAIRRYAVFAPLHGTSAPRRLPFRRKVPKGSRIGILVDLDVPAGQAFPVTLKIEMTLD